MIDKMYALLCYLALVDVGEKQESPAPSYLAEKTVMLDAGLDAFGFLDYKNKEKVLDYLKHWKEAIPPIWQESYDMEMKAIEDLGFSFDDDETI